MFQTMNTLAKKMIHQRCYGCWLETTTVPVRADQPAGDCYYHKSPLQRQESVTPGRFLAVQFHNLGVPVVSVGIVPEAAT